MQPEHTSSPRSRSVHSADRLLPATHAPGRWPGRPRTANPKSAPTGGITGRVDHATTDRLDGAQDQWVKSAVNRRRSIVSELKRPGREAGIDPAAGSPASLLALSYGYGSRDHELPVVADLADGKHRSAFFDCSRQTREPPSAGGSAPRDTRFRERPGLIGVARITVLCTPAWLVRGQAIGYDHKGPASANCVIAPRMTQPSTLQANTRRLAVSARRPSRRPGRRTMRRASHRLRSAGWTEGWSIGPTRRHACPPGVMTTWS
jgi:hypothetical protein